MSVLAPTAEQTEIRLAMLKNGYTPLGSECKAVKIKNWSHLDVTEKLVERWKRREDLVTSGVRVDSPLVVMDFDIDDAATIDKVFAAIEAKDAALGEALAAAPCRFGGGHKLALFLRSEDGVRGTWHSKAYYRPWDVESDETKAKLQRLEVFGAGSEGEDARYMATNGAHTLGPDGEVVRGYVWEDGRDLTVVAVNDLPVITKAQVLLAVDTASEVLHEAGWVYEVSSKSGKSASAVEYALIPEMQFRTNFGDIVDLAGLEEVCDTYDLRVCMDFIQKGAQNVTRGLVGRSPADGRVYVFDTASRTRYRPADLDIGAKVVALGDKLKAEDSGASRLEKLAASVPVENRMFGSSGSDEGGGGPSEEDVKAGRKKIVDDLIDRYAYWSDSKGFVVDVFRGPEAAMTLGSFGAKMEPWGWVEYGPRGGEKEINPADLWRKDPRRLDVGGYRFLPWSRDRLVKVAGEVYVNTWERPAWWDDATARPEADDSLAVGAFKAFLEHLIPDESERSWFIQWIAAKVQKPWLPNCGVIMVAERQGTGRGTLFDILRGVFGARHVRNVGSGQLLGNGSQAQYNDWIADSLLVTCDEVLTGDDSGGAMAWKRREAYERLKGLVDPRARDIQIVRKGLPNTAGEVFASFLLATNNVNALPLSPDDRRIAVVTNSSVPLVHRRGVMERLAPWRTDVGFTEAMGAAVYRWLCGVEVEWNAIREAPTWMAGRARMLAANEGDLESVLDSVLQEIPGDYILAGHLRERLGKALEAAGLDREIKAWWVRASDLLGRINNFGWRRRDGRCKFQPRSMGNQVSLVFYRDEPGRLEAWENASLEERVEMWSKSKDLNAKLSAIQTKMKERGLRIEK